MTVDQVPAGRATVRISCAAGDVVGLLTPIGREFRGIPYADAPIALDRFREPRRRAPFGLPFHATRWGATPQRVPLAEVTFVPEPTIPGEDILNLNVFTPADACPRDRRPVVLWIHGGGFRAGSTPGAWYHGEALVAAGAIMVVPSYRLAFDGFGWLADGSDNRGLRDLILALEWVRDNIASFGGDPERVTIAGQSAGGSAVLALLAAPSARGLFARAWSMSGVLVAQTIAEATAFTRSFASTVAVEPTVAGFSAIDDATLQRALGTVDLDDARPLAFGPVPGRLSVAPVVGSETLPGDIVAGLHDIGGTVPLVIGATAEEFVEPVGTPPVEDALWREMTASWGPAGERYGDGVPPAARTPGRLATDALFRSAVAAAIISRARASAPTWVYDVRWAPPTLGRASHCIDIPLFLGIAGTESTRGKVDDAEPLASVMHHEFVAFVRGDNPGWPAMSGTVVPTRVYDKPDGLEDDVYGPLSAMGTQWSRADVL